jgi:fatty-acyl-CoA synthase
MSLFSSLLRRRASHSAGACNTDMEPCAANFLPLSPLSFLTWSATVHPSHIAVIDGDTRLTYAAFYEHCCRLAGALSMRNVRHGHVVSVLSDNRLEAIALHYAVPMLGAVIHPIDPRLPASEIARQLTHAESTVLVVDPTHLTTAREALPLSSIKPLLVEMAASPTLGKLTYDALIAEGSGNFEWPGPQDEWDAISLCYTQGTEGAPKGVVFHHRGAYLNATGDVLTNGMTQACRYLWTLPLARSNGWGYVWAVSAVGGTQITPRERTDRTALLDAIRTHDVTHLCGEQGLLELLTGGGAVPPLPSKPSLSLVSPRPENGLIEQAEAMGFSLSFLYGLTECYGVAGLSGWTNGGKTSATSSTHEVLLAHPTAHSPMLDDIIVVDPESLQRLPADGVSVGAVVLRGNSVAKGYLKDAEGTEQAFRDGWFHTGDRGVIHPDGRIEIVERARTYARHGQEPRAS